MRRLPDDVLGIGGLLVRRNLEIATGPNGPARWLAKTQVPRRGGSEDDEAPVP